MPESPNRQSIEPRAAGQAERIFALVPGFAQRILRARTEEERQGLVGQVGKELAELRGYVMGQGSGLSERAVFRMRGEFAQNTFYLQEAIIAAELEAEPLSPKIGKLLETRTVPREGFQGVSDDVIRKINGIQELLARSGKHIDPAWGSFLYRIGIGRAVLEDFQADEWYAEVMSQEHTLLKKIALPLVVVDQAEIAARERAKPMVTQRIVEEAVHRAKNALEELIEIWDKEFPALADTYRLVAQALDQEVENLSLFYRYEARKK